MAQFNRWGGPARGPGFGSTRRLQDGRRERGAHETPPVPCTVHVVTAENRSFYKRSLEESFRQRHRFFSVEYDWLPAQNSSDREVDEYDTDDAIYFLAFEDLSERLVGSVRLLPTVRKVPLKEYVGLAGGYDLPRSPHIYHLSRMVVVADRREGQAMNFVRASLRCAVQEFCLAEDIEHLSLLTPVALLPTFLALGWNPTPLALPELYRGTTCVVATVDISEVALERTREAAGIPRSLLIKRGITRPAYSGAMYPTRLS